MALLFSADGRTLAAATAGQPWSPGLGTICLWETATGKPRWQTPITEGSALTLAFSPDGRILAAGGDDHRIRRWNLALSRELAPLVGHLGPVTSLALSADGMLLASGSTDATVTTWMEPFPQPSKSSRSATLGADELEALWNDMANADAEKAYRASWTLIEATGQAVPFLDAHLRMAPRAVAQRETEQPAHDQRAASLRAQSVRVKRAVEILEHVRTPEARRALETLARGPAGALITAEAGTAFRRLHRRQVGQP